MAVNSTNYKFNTPTTGTEEDTWGEKLNENWDKMDSLLYGASYTDGDGYTVEQIQPDLAEGSWAIAGTAVTSTAAELNILDGVTATTAELNILDGVTSTTAELNTLDGVTVTTTELNILDGDTSATSTTLADADRIVVNDDGTMKQVAMSDVATYIGVPDLSPYAQLSGATFTGAVSGTDITLSGNLTVNGTTTTLDSTNTVIEDNLLELNSGVTSNANDSGIIIERGSTGDNAVMLWDESADKFAFGTTTSTADSTGNIAYTAAPVISNYHEINTTNTGLYDLQITRTSTLGFGPRIVTRWDNSSISDNDEIFSWDFQAKNSNDTFTTYASMEVKSNDVTAGTNDGIFDFFSMVAGTNTRRISLTPSEIQFYGGGSFSDVSISDTQTRVSNALIAEDTFYIGSAGNATVDSIKDEDNMSSNSATALATQQSIKAYVDNNSTTISNSSGSAPFYAARAWGSFDGTDYTGSAIDLTNYSTGNVSSIDRTGTGQYTINFSTAMPNTTYTFIGTINGNTPSGGGRELLFFSLSQTTTSVTVQCQREETETFVDAGVLSFLIFAG